MNPSINDRLNNNNPVTHIIFITESKQIILNFIQIPLIKWIKMNNINNDTPITCKKRMNHPILTSDIIYTIESNAIL